MSPKAEYGRPKCSANEARVKSDQARLALEQHIAAHRRSYLGMTIGAKIRVFLAKPSLVPQLLGFETRRQSGPLVRGCIAL